MRWLLLLMFLVSPLREVVNVQFSIPTQQHEIFCNYNNDNFTQTVRVDRSGRCVTAHVKNLNYFALNLNFRVMPDQKYLSSLLPEMQETVNRMLKDSLDFEAYFKNISLYLKHRITYADTNLPQSAASVLFNKRANCVGFSNFTQVLLNAAGIKNKVVRGFYLEGDPARRGGKMMTPIPHRWLEITLPNGIRFFYDPQFQKFSANYLTTKEDIDFRQVKKFKVNVIKKSKQFINQ